MPCNRGKECAKLAWIVEMKEPVAAVGDAKTVRYWRWICDDIQPNFEQVIQFAFPEIGPAVDLLDSPPVIRLHDEASLRLPYALDCLALLEKKTLHGFASRRSAESHAAQGCQNFSILRSTPSII